jgi:nitrite reductase (NADH) large subunit
LRLIIVGGGIAAITAARGVRGAAPDIEIDIYTDEPYRFYRRPSLIEFLADKVDQEELFVYSPEWYANKGINLHLSSAVVGLDTRGQTIHLETGEETTYDRLLLATGSHPFRPPLEGLDKEGVFTIRSLDDARAIKSYAQENVSKGRTEAIVLGGGLMGLECANALATLGLEVTVLQGGPWLLNRQVDPQGADVLEEHLSHLGVRCLSNVRLESVLGADRVSGVRLQDGREFKAHLVLCAAGVRANLELARAGGLKTGRGVLVDSEMCTSAEHVYAAGDVAEYYGEAWQIIPAAVNQARVAAANIVEPGSVKYQGTVPSTTLKVVGVDLTSIGVIDGGTEGLEEFRRADHESFIYEKLVVEDGRVVGAVLLGSKEKVPAVTRLIREGTDVSESKHRLLEEGFELLSLLQ